VLSFLANFANKAELRESKDEMLVGEIVRAMSRRGWPATAFRSNNDRQWVQFRMVGDPVLHNSYVTLDRKTGSSALQQAIIGSKATLTIAAEVKNMLTDPDDLVKMYKTDLANLFKMPVLGGIKLNHELNSVFATTTTVIDIDTYISKGETGVTGLANLLAGTIDKLKEKLGPYKKA
jgi:hypothetical protein